MNNLEIITDTDSKRIKLIGKSILVGIFASLISVLYRYSLTIAEKCSFSIYNYAKENLWFIPIWFIVLGLIGFIVGKVVEKEPFSSGSGIPQVKAIMGGYLSDNPVTVIIGKFIGGVLAIVSGLSLGREGPSVQLGACAGEIVADKCKSTKLEKRLLMSSGASAGLAAAFNAPLAGVLFSVEEIYKYISPLVLVTTLSSAVVSDFIAKEFFGLQPVFEFGKATSLPLSTYWLLIFLGIILGLCGVFYNYSIEKMQSLYGKFKIKPSIKMIFPFLISGIVGFIFPVILCGGHATIIELSLEKTLGMLFLMLICKFTFSIFSFGSGAPGGIFFPLLIIGACIGGIFGSISITYLGVSPEFFNNFLIISMAGFFTAIVRAPITGIILITEMTSSLNHLLSLTIVCIIAYIVADLFKSVPIYDSLLESLLKKNNIKKLYKAGSKKVLISNVVHYGSNADGKRLKDIELHPDALVVSIKRGEDSIVPNGNTLIKAGDEILTMTDLSIECEVREDLEHITSKI
ncbi:MAG: ClC family H(+)/Cl(-) exchange transporter [Clostridium sp.]|nr:ClC family H(+)/Cl(-) exchange transporter [Clostridium sp.]